MLSKYRKIRATRRAGDAGFTLIELLVVVVIIGVLIAIAIPVYSNYQKSSYDKSAQSDVRNAIAVVENCLTIKGSYPDSDAATNSGDTPVSEIALEGCDDAKLVLSEGTTLQYTKTDSTYEICAFNTNGTEDSYKYNSSDGGAVAAAEDLKRCGAGEDADAGQG